MPPDPPPTAVHRIVVSVHELDAALALYGDVLGLPVTLRTAETARLTTVTGVEVLLHQRPSAPSDTAVAATFAVADLFATVEAWARCGGSVVDAPADRPWGERMAVVRDADGHLVCLVQTA